MLSSMLAPRVPAAAARPAHRTVRRVKEADRSHVDRHAPHRSRRRRRRGGGAAPGARASPSARLREAVARRATPARSGCSRPPASSCATRWPASPPQVLSQTAASLNRELASRAPRRRRARRGRDGPPRRRAARARRADAGAPGQGRRADRAARARAPRGAGHDGRDGPLAERGPRRPAFGDRQPRRRAAAPVGARRLGRDPAAQRDRDGGDGRPLRLRRAVATHRGGAPRAACAPTCSCGSPAAS